MDDQTKREARVIAGIELAVTYISPDECMVDEWGIPLPGDPDAIEAYAEAHDPQFVVIAINDVSRLVRLCDTEGQVRDVLKSGLPARFDAALADIPIQVHSLAKVVPVDGSHPGRSSNQHYQCIPYEVTDLFLRRRL